MKYVKQKTFSVGPLHVNMFSVPTKQFNNYGLRVSISLYKMHLLFTYK